MKNTLIAAVIALSVGVARAGPSAMESAYRDGHYSLTVSLAESDGTATALAFAARARLAQSTFETNPRARDSDVDSAIDLCRRALKIDPNKNEAHVQLAIALGLKARQVGAIRAHIMGLGSEAHDHIKAVLARDPNSSWALGVLGAWNLEIINRGGPTAASIFYGASRQAGVSAYNQALALAPDNLVLQYERALTFITFDPEGLENEALAGLAAVAELHPQDALETELQARGARVAAAIRADDYDALVKMLIAYRGGYEDPATFWPEHVRHKKDKD